MKGLSEAERCWLPRLGLTEKRGCFAYLMMWSIWQPQSLREMTLDAQSIDTLPWHRGLLFESWRHGTEFAGWRWYCWKSWNGFPSLYIIRMPSYFFCFSRAGGSIKARSTLGWMESESTRFFHEGKSGCDACWNHPTDSKEPVQVTGLSVLGKSGKPRKIFLSRNIYLVESLFGFPFYQWISYSSTLSQHAETSGAITKMLDCAVEDHILYSNATTYSKSLL